MQTLSISYAQLEDDDVKPRVLSFLQHGGNSPGRVTCVDVRFNFITPFGVQCLMEAIKPCINLRTLQLAGNQVKDEGADHLAKSLPHWPHLECLNVENAGVEDQGGIALARAASQHPSLKKMLLYGNDISYLTRDAVCAMLSKCMNPQIAFKLDSTMVRDGLHAALAWAGRVHQPRSRMMAWQAASLREPQDHDQLHHHRTRSTLERMEPQKTRFLALQDFQHGDGDHRAARLVAAFLFSAS